ncbi:MAG: acyl-CoA dehydrogenase family protein [Hyphomicrobiaceae bacterium]|nr:acyl-CoA dehydrogenase family protein [Hyphomicrobiaceae bacterium]
MIDLSLPADLQDLKARTAAFVREELLPLERDPRAAGHISDAFRRELNARAAARGLLAPQVGTAWGGLGLSHVGRAAVFEEAGYSFLGPLAMHLSAPDEANMHMLEEIASEEQKARWLARLTSGEIRSSFLMTEPAPGAGADPGLLKTTARRDGNHFVIDGHKWLITGAHGAGLYIIMARMADEDGATMFLCEPDTAGITLVREVGTMAEGFAGGHAEVRLDGVRLPASAVLGEVGKGFQYAQVRLVPARLTHCMRWLGAARRCHDIALDYALDRTAFGKPLHEHEGVGFMIADNEMELNLARLSILQCAWLLDTGDKANMESGLAKVFCSEALFRVADRSLQILGGTGVSTDTVVERFFREIRAFRVYDGPSEVHRWAIARRLTYRRARARKA